MKPIRVFVELPAGDVRDSFFDAGVIARLESLAEARWNDTGRHLSPAELSRALEGFEVCVTGWGTPRFDEEVLSGVESLRLVAHTGGSVASLVSEEFFDRGVRIVSANKVFAESVAEAVVAYALASLRRIPFWSNELTGGRWRSEQWKNGGLLDKRVGLVGFGAVARYLVPMLAPFRSAICAYDPFVDPALIRGFGVAPGSLEEVIAGSQIISVHASRNPGTEHLIDRALIRRIPDGALFINTARGSIVDETALADELATGRFDAVLDVFEVEPLPADSPLRALPNVILLPHMAGPTLDRRLYSTMAVIDDIERLARGVPLEHEIEKSYAVSMTAAGTKAGDYR